MSHRVNCFPEVPYPVIAIFMAALCNRVAIIFLPCSFFLSIFYLSFFFFLALSQQPQIGCLPYFYTWYGPSVNLEYRSEMCCTQLAGNTGGKNDAKNRHLCTIGQLCRAVSSQLRHVSTIGKRLVKQQYLLLHMS